MSRKNSVRASALPALLAALACSLAWTGAAQAEPTLAGVKLGEYASGPRLAAKDLKGRVVVFEYWGNQCPPCKKAIPHVAALQAKYPHQSVIVIANQSWEGDPADTAKIWADHGGGTKVAVIHRGSLPGAHPNGVPHAFVFDAAGKMVFDGYPGGGMDNAVAKAVKESPAGKAADAAQDRAKEIYGDHIPEALMKIAVQGSDTAHSSETATKALERAAQAKDPKLAEAAKKMLSSFDTHVAGQFEAALKLAAEEPAKAWAAMETIARWAPHKEEGVKAQKQKAEWLRNAAFLKELAADKAWLSLKAQADKIDFEKNPKAKPTNQLESDFKKLLKDKDAPGTKGLAKAKAAAAGWKLDPETGKSAAK